MRNLEECRTEVFARSEKRIAKRRKIRQRVVAGLGPFCLCVVLLFVLPMMRFQKSYECMPEDFGNIECAGEPAYGAVDTKNQEATVICKDGERWILSEYQTKQLTHLLDSYINDGEKTENSFETDYKIEITTADGTMICYFLSDSDLICDGLTVHLTDSEFQQILEIIQPESE